MAKTPKEKLSPRELVLQRYPNAFVDDDGEWVRIENMKTVSENCPHCRQEWTHKVVDLLGTLGAGNCAENAWKNAAKRLGLI